jgi:hypothetical protein
MTKLNLYVLKTINTHSQDILLEYSNKCITMDFNTNFLGTILGNTLHWKKHIDTQIMKLNVACYVIRTLQHIMPHYLWFIFSLPCPMTLFCGATNRIVSIYSNKKNAEQ